MVVVTGRGRPHEAFMLAASTLLGAALLAGATPPASVEQQLPGWIRWTWYLLLLISGSVGLAGLAWREPYVALVLERAAMVGQAAAPALYALALVGFGRWAALASGVLLAAWSAASAWRLVQVVREIRDVRDEEGK